MAFSGGAAESLSADSSSVICGTLFPLLLSLPLSPRSALIGPFNQRVFICLPSCDVTGPFGSRQRLVLLFCCSHCWAFQAQISVLMLNSSFKIHVVFHQNGFSLLVHACVNCYRELRCAPMQRISESIVFFIQLNTETDDKHSDVSH